jgi:hypothetical protein
MITSSRTQQLLLETIVLRLHLRLCLTVAAM